jgi:hypothetical protein
MKTLFKFCALLLFVGIFISCEEEPCTDFDCTTEINELPINEFQFLGSHNSYRKSTDEDIFQFLLDPPFPLPPDFEPLSLEYSHLPLNQQFDDFGIRAIELDVYRDPDGGRFYLRIGKAVIGQDPVSGEDALLEAGLKVLHIPDIDFNSNYLTFKEALSVVKSWSDAHPNHLPITIMVDAKEDSPCDIMNDPMFTCALPFDEVGVEEIEHEISDVFSNPNSELIVPDDLRGSFSTVNEAALANAWPSMKNARGKIMFVLFGSQEIIDNYVGNNSSLVNRNMFVFSQAGNPETAFINIDDPQADNQTIANLIADGYMVRTRADADTNEARSNETSRRQTALASGAQLIYTDYYSNELNKWTDYVVDFEGGKLARYSVPMSDIETQDCFDPCTVIE